MSIVVLVNAAVTGSNLFKMEIISFFFFKMKKSSQRESQTTGDAYTTILYKMETIRVFSFLFVVGKENIIFFFSAKRKEEWSQPKERNCCDSFHSLVFQLEWLLTDTFDDGQGHPTFFIEKFFFVNFVLETFFFNLLFLETEHVVAIDWKTKKKKISKLE